MAFKPVIPLSELWQDDMLGCVVDGRKVLLVRMGDEVFAYEDRCAHLGMPLSAGKFADGVLICGAHMFEYDARTGRGINPRNVRLRPFPVKLENGEIWVDTQGDEKDDD